MGAVQIDIDAIPRVIPWDNDDIADEIETKGAAGGMPELQPKNNSTNQYSVEALWDDSEDESSDEAVYIAKEEEEARDLREEYIHEWLTKKNSDEIVNSVREAAQTNKINSSIPLLR